MQIKESIIVMAAGMALSFILPFWVFVPLFAYAVFIALGHCINILLVALICPKKYTHG